jgi:hypothetical protein
MCYTQELHFVLDTSACLPWLGSGSALAVLLLRLMLTLCSWGIMFSHPADFTPVCTTELSLVIKLLPEFAKRNVKVIALSCEDTDKHLAWIPDLQAWLRF